MQMRMVVLGMWMMTFGSGVAGCTPRVEVAPPEKPITINLNVKIDHEIRVKVDKELDQVLSDKGGLF
ncbi:MAG: YnbE family lipoprotein [Nitrospiraceae bacterium]